MKRKTRKLVGRKLDFLYTAGKGDGRYIGCFPSDSPVPINSSDRSGSSLKCRSVNGYQTAKGYPTELRMGEREVWEADSGERDGWG